MISMITGIMVAIMRLMNRVTSARSLFALSKRSSSKPCLLKARMTIIPERFSRVTRFNRSINFWMIVNLGTEMKKTITINKINTATARAMIHHMFGLLSTARTTPPIPMIGAKNASRITMNTTCWSWVISLVARVISEAVEKLLYSWLEKDSTLVKTSLRISLATLAEVRAAK